MVKTKAEGSEALTPQALWEWLSNSRSHKACGNVILWLIMRNASTRPLNVHRKNAKCNHSNLNLKLSLNLYSPLSFKISYKKAVVKLFFLQFLLHFFCLFVIFAFWSTYAQPQLNSTQFELWLRGAFQTKNVSNYGKIQNSTKIKIVYISNVVKLWRRGWS